MERQKITIKAVPSAFAELLSYSASADYPAKFEERRRIREGRPIIACPGRQARDFLRFISKAKVNK